MRKVIQITEQGIYLCDDGTMWERFTPLGEMGPNGFRKKTTTKWVQLDSVPQPDRSALAEMAIESVDRSIKKRSEDYKEMMEQHRLSMELIRN